MAELDEKTGLQQEGEYSSYPEGFELLLERLKFPTEDENMKRMMLKMTVSSLLHY